MANANIKALIAVIIMMLVIMVMLSKYNKPYIEGNFNQKWPAQRAPAFVLKYGCNTVEKGGVEICASMFEENWIENTNDFSVVIIKMARGRTMQRAYTEWKKEFAPHEWQSDTIGIGDKFYIFKDKQLLGFIEPLEFPARQRHNRDNPIRGNEMP